MKSGGNWHLIHLCVCIALYVYTMVIQICAYACEIILWKTYITFTLLVDMHVL